MPELIKNKYWSPRISWEYMDCSMPVTFDQYSNCWFGCIYCFATFQRGIWIWACDYWKKENVKSANIEKFMEQFNPDSKGLFAPYFKDKKTIQWWWMSDPLCPFEEHFWIWYKMIKFLRDKNYPCRFSSKSDLILRSDKYFELFKWAKNFYYMSSIITYNEEIAKKIEINVPSPENRLKTLGRLAKSWVETCLRLRPFIIWISDKNLETLIKRASEEWVKHLSMEFFCLEMRATEILKQRYRILSDIAWFDIYEFYRRLSTWSWYLRLNYWIKEKYIKKIMDLCSKYWLNFNCSDAHHKEKSKSSSCCWVPEDHPILWNFQKWQFTNALKIARERSDHKVYWSDIDNDANILNNFKFCDNIWVNKIDWKTIAKRRWFTLKELMRNEWNNPNSWHSPYKYFWWALVPVWLDENKNIVYKFDENKTKFKEWKDKKCIKCNNC